MSERGTTTSFRCQGPWHAWNFPVTRRPDESVACVCGETTKTTQELVEHLEQLENRRAWSSFQCVTPTTNAYSLGDDEEMYSNNKYQVIVRRLDDIGRHLSIKRLDKQAIRDWRDLQRIKNELIGSEAEAIELFPAESRLIDGANQFHLWALLAPHRFPFGFSTGRVVSSGGALGSTQRPWFRGEEPSDALDKDEAERLIAMRKRRPQS